MADKSFAELYEQRYGVAADPADNEQPLAEGVARIINRRVVRQFEDRAIPTAERAAGPRSLMLL